MDEYETRCLTAEEYAELRAQLDADDVRPYVVQIGEGDG